MKLLPLFPLSSHRSLISVAVYLILLLERELLENESGKLSTLSNSLCCSLPILSTSQSGSTGHGLISWASELSQAKPGGDM